MKDYKRENPVVGAYSNTPLNESLSWQMVHFVTSSFFWKTSDIKSRCKDAEGCLKERQGGYMKIGEAKGIYRGQISEYQEQKKLLSQRKQELEEKMKHSTDVNELFAKEAATLELTINALDKKQREYQDYMSKLEMQSIGHANALIAKQQTEAMEEYNQDLMKVMEVARRLMKGAIVPPTDEKKLMEYSMELYQAAKNIGSLVKQREKEEYESLWNEEGEKSTPEDPMEVADNKEAFSSGPAIVDVADTMASVEAPDD